MIQPNDLKAGNWISLNYSGSLLAAHKVLEVTRYGVAVENAKSNTLIKIENIWKYPEEELKELDFEEIKGIPLTPEILEGCGFKLNYKTTLTEQSRTEDSITKYYSGKHFFTLNYKPGAPCRFTHEIRNSNIEFVHQLQNLYLNFMNRELEITIQPYNFKLLS